MDAVFIEQTRWAILHLRGENMAKKAEQPNNLQMLKTALRDKNPDRLYFFCGEETFLLHHYLGQLKKLLLDDLTESFNFHKFTSENFDVLSFADAVENLPMMAESTLVWVDDVDIFKFAEGDRERMAEIFSDIPDYCTVVFTFITTVWKPDSRQRKYCDVIKKYGTLVEFQKQELRDLIPWVTRHFAASHKRITPDLCAYLIEITGGTMTALAGEISKICAYSGAEDVRRSDIDAVTEPVLDAVVFQMTDYLGQGQYGAALQKLQQLFKMQQKPTAILGAVGSHFRRMSTARILLDHGKQASELMRLYGVGDYAARKTMSAAGKFSHSFYKRVSELVIETDAALKTSYDDPERMLEVLLVQIAQEARNG